MKPACLFLLLAWLTVVFTVTAQDRPSPTPLKATESAQSPFLSGADMSLLAFFESSNVIYKNDGIPVDALALLKSKGINCIRLRLFTSSPVQAQADPYNYINNTQYTLPLAVRVKNAGLQLMLDFHYSDTWADPAHQNTPQDWRSLSFASLVTQMRSYNSNCIATLKNAGALPDYVQIGNEITGGILWTNGQLYGGSNTTNQWNKLGQLLTAAIQGIQDACPSNPPKIIVHIDRGGDWSRTQYFFDHLIQTQKVQFDIIGLSYYPFWHGSPANLVNCLSNAACVYGKPVMVCETAFPWTNSVWRTNIFGFSPTTNGQANYLVSLAKIVRSVPNGLGAGICWWGTEYQSLHGVQEAGFDTASLFDNQGNVLPAASVLGQMTAPILLTARHDPEQLHVEWPLSGAGLQLSSTTTLMSSSAWEPVTNRIQTNGATFHVILPLTNSVPHYFRLQGN